ncbi:MAG: cbb3-type cytochrome c oxidase subunit 3 [Moraxellaceae bacterium]|nr:cbb3-type cytochrome c oxidase subunit 3 [Moraxellaceae bacterium]MBP9045207.1 cbb3-type cytochrome c oxidase subunit 3 [Moraxellaceae bacterium]MBP9730596.1 cbb3-type cytochrome c oxidase subunit 3 [Moraxellaceae bacterium]HQX89304.1 cbb3-type cytochrome c oxidase subunit 3 [Moraxellaceae bacterium]
MDYGLWHSIATVAAILAFAGVVWWAYSPSNRKRFEDIGNLPFENDPILTRPRSTAEVQGTREKSE